MRFKFGTLITCEKAHQLYSFRLSIIQHSIMLNHRQSSPVDSVLSGVLAVYSYLVKVICKSADCFCCFYFGFYVAHHVFL